MSENEQASGADEFIERIVADTRRMHADGAPRHQVLGYLASAAEQVHQGDTVASILLLDKGGLLRNGASPRLPYDYLTAIDGLKPNPRLGTCAAAAATGNVVLTPDFQRDDKWAELRHLPLALGFVAAWSHPITDKSGKVLGTFGTYFREAREPSAAEIAGVRALARMAAEILA